MFMKLIGAALVIISCGGVGFKIAFNYRQEERTLRQLIDILDFMECELKYRLTPLPELFRMTAKTFRNTCGSVLQNIALEMDKQNFYDLNQCFEHVLNNTKFIPAITHYELKLLGNSLGKFDLEGQLKGLHSVREDCKRNVILLTDKQETRLRNYQTLGLCAGAALAILFI